MSTPVVTDVVLAVRKMLAAQSDVCALLGSDSRFDTWLFQDTLFATVENSQTCAVVLTLEGGWTAPNDYNTARFPRLGTTIYADPKRDSANNITSDDTRNKILAVHQVLDKYLHRPTKATAIWGGLRILASTRLNEPYPRPWVDGDHAASAQVFYALGVG